MPALVPDVDVHPVDGISPNDNRSAWINQDDVVISGMSARLPESDSVAEFEKNLYDGVDMVTDDERRWPTGIFGLPSRTGKLKDLKHFDASFFGVHAKQAEVMDPQLRLMLEATYEALVDAGVNPATVKGSNIGVFIGVSTSETEDYHNREANRVNGYGLTGCCRAMFPNRVSYTFDFKGPSYAIDTACSSSLFGLQQALTAIRTGQCDAAVVGGCNLCLRPTSSLQFHKLSMLSPQGMCKAFDASGNGYVRSEAVVALFLQKSSDAKRVYATVVNAKTNTDGAKEQGITFPSGACQKNLIQQVYQEANVNPADVAYVEAHGTGTKVGDPQEVNSIVDVFCKGRSSPLLIGSVKSNMGHSEPASGLCSIVKVLIGLEKGIIPPNLHFQTPNKDIPGLNDGRLQVVHKPWPFNGGYVAINSFGFGGANAHVLLKSNPKPKESPIQDEIPRLVCVSGRTENAVNNMLDKVINSGRDDDLIALLHNVHNQNIAGHSYRGFTVLNNNASKEVSSYNDNEEARPIWYVFSGMGSQWAGMAKDLLKLPQFDQSVRKAAQVLQAEGFDLYNVLKSEDESTFDNVLNSFVSITVIQVALVDLLKTIGIEPDGIVGHSVGELGCAYADGTFTSEQAVLAAYWRGRSILESQLPKGAMAAIGLSWEETQKRVPQDIVAACHNSTDSVTISGPPESIQKFVRQLQSEDIFAKEVKSSGFAFHSKYIADAGPKLRKHLERIIPSPKPRSSKWISSSVPESGWATPLAQLSSAAYHVSNLLSPVLFHEALQHVPENAVVIEIAPHALLQAILKRALGPNATVLGLVKRLHANNLEFLLSNLGKCFNAGVQPKLAHLFHPVKFPVSRGTPMIQSMVEWDHSTEWFVADFSDMVLENGKVAWSDNWITYLEAMLQLHLLSIEKQRHYAIDHIRRIVLDPSKHNRQVQLANNVVKSGLAVKFSATANVITSAGVEIGGVKSTLVSARKKQLEPIILHSAFVPHLSNKMFTPSEAISISAQLVFENINNSAEQVDRVNVAEIASPSNPCASLDILKTAKMQPYISARVTLYDTKQGANAADADASSAAASVATAEAKNVTVVAVCDRASLVRRLRESRKRYNLMVADAALCASGDERSYLDSELFGILIDAVDDDDGFLLVLEHAGTGAAGVNESQSHVNDSRCKLIAKFQTSIGTYTLIRKTPKWKTSMVIVIRNDTFNWVDGVKMALRKYQIDKRTTMLVYQGNDASGLIGFMKSIRREPFGRGLRCLFTDDSIYPYAIKDLEYIEYLRKGLVFNVYRDGQWGSYCNFNVDKPATVECEHAFFGVRQIGDLSTLTYIEARIPHIELSNLVSHELCYVYYTSIYAHDVRCAMGSLPYDDYTNSTKQGSPLGHEYSGRDSKGRRVFGVVGSGALATTVLADKTLMWNVPDCWSLEQASTVPRVYGIAYYALVLRADLRRGESVYINAGAMSLCVACVNVAQGIGARVFVGFRSRLENKYLKEWFPRLPENSFVDLEESTLDSILLERTNQKGVDVIFDTLNSHKRSSFVDSLAFDGRLVEFEKSSVFDETAGYAAAEKNVTFYKISHRTLWVSDAGLNDRKRVRQLVDEGVRSGIVQPILANVFAESDISEAFRVTQSGKYVGKVVVKIRDEESRAAIVPETKLVKAYPSVFLNSRNSYIVTGGLTDFGIQIVNWLVDRGATKIVLQSQYRPVTGYQCLALRRWRNCDVHVTLCNADAASEIGAQLLLENANKLAPVAGIFHAACMESDRPFAECTTNQLQLLWKLKVDVAKHLDLASRKLCPSLKYFVAFSDTAVLYGVNGKTSSAYVNSAMESVYVKRKAQNYPATIIRKGPIEKFNGTSSYRKRNEACAVAMKNTAVIENMPNLLNQPFETLSIYNVSEKREHKSESTARTNELIDEIADLLEIRNPKLYNHSKFQDIGMDPVVKADLEDLLNKFGVDSLPAATTVGQLSFAKLTSLLRDEQK